MTKTTPNTRKTILTGDRPTGQLHLGHYVGSLASRVALQDHHDQTVLIADLQALTDNAGNPQKVRSNILEVMLDYLAVGLDPDKTTFALQSSLRALSELTMLYMNLVNVNHLMRNPTIRAEVKDRGFGEHVPAGFLCYPISQAADITAFKAHLVPAGADQAPLIEQSNAVVSAINRMAGRELLPMSSLLESHASRLPGIDGKGKMSKSAGNAILLSDSPDEIRRKVMAMFTDPEHLRVADPGKVEGNVVFAMLDAFDPDTATVMELKELYRRGGLGDMALKRRLEPMIQEVIRPIRTRRQQLSEDLGFVRNILADGSERARDVTDETLMEVREAFDILEL